MSWSDQYIGIPALEGGADRHGCDCYGLLRLVYFEQLEITLPFYRGSVASKAEMLEVHDIIQAEKKCGRWSPVNGSPKPFDILAFRLGQFDMHLGIYAQSGLMLHIARDRAAILESYDGLNWSNRLTGIWRYQPSVADQAKRSFVQGRERALV